MIPYIHLYHAHSSSSCTPFPPPSASPTPAPLPPPPLRPPAPLTTSKKTTRRRRGSGRWPTSTDESRSWRPGSSRVSARVPARRCCPYVCVYIPHDLTHIHIHAPNSPNTDGDDVDPEAGEWELLYLVQRPPRQHQHQEQQHHHHRDATLAGYLTIYAFNNPLKGKGLRICQALVLPPFQRQGTCLTEGRRAWVGWNTLLTRVHPLSHIHISDRPNDRPRQGTASACSVPPTPWRGSGTWCSR